MKKKKKIIIVVIIILGTVVMLAEHREETAMLRDGLKRGKPGSVVQEKEFYYSTSDGVKEKVKVKVGAQTLPEEKALELLDQAKAEWNRQYLGENDSATKVSKDLSLPTSLQEGLVAVTYEWDDARYVNDDGKVLQDILPDAGVDVCLTVQFSYENYRLEDQVKLSLQKRVLTSQERFAKSVQKQVNDTEKKNRQKMFFQLPTSVDGQPITWSTETHYTGLFIIVLGLAAVFAIGAEEAERKKRLWKKRNQVLESEYPQMVEQISLLLSSGMTVRAAWGKMVQTYQRLRKDTNCNKKLYLEEMTITYREIEEGCGERESYEQFGKRIGSAHYRQFSSALSQNVSKGTRNMQAILAEEARLALEEQRTTARRLGEEAGNKLLGPMMVMFLMILAVVLFPAIQNM